jgi:hypothetical protein
MKVSMARAWNLNPRLGSHELRFWFIFFSLCDWTSTSSCFMKVSFPRAWNQTSKVGSDELRFWFSLFFAVELQSSSCFLQVSLPSTWNVSPSLAQMSWNTDLFFHSIWLNFKLQGVLWRSRCRELEIWDQGLALMSWNFDLFFLVFLIELRTSSCFMKVSLSRAEICPNDWPK